MVNDHTKNFIRSVKIQIPMEERRNLRVKRRGITMNIYAPIVDGENLLKIPDYNKNKIDWVDISLTSSSINPTPLQSRDVRDIDEELAEIDSNYRIIKDRLTHTDNKNLINYNQSKENYIRHAIPETHPFLSGENDKLRKNMTEVQDVNVPMEEVKFYENHFEKNKRFYKTPKFTDKYEVTQDKFGMKYGKFKIGYI